MTLLLAEAGLEWRTSDCPSNPHIGMKRHQVDIHFVWYNLRAHSPKSLFGWTQLISKEASSRRYGTRTLEGFRTKPGLLVQNPG